MIPNHPFRAVAVTALAAGLGAVMFGLAPDATAATPPAAGGLASHAVFIQTDGSSGNRILAYRRGLNGTVALAGSYATGGDGATAAGASADPLASQGGLTLVDGNRELLAVNAGSDTVTLFTVHGASLTKDEVVASEGEFPASVAADGSLVAVLNAGGAGSVAVFRLVGSHLDPVQGDVRSLGLDNTNPPNYLEGAGQVGFTPDGEHLVVTTKMSTNAYEVWSVSPTGALGADAAVTAAATPVPFAFSFGSAGQLVGAEAGSSTVSSYTIEPDGSLTLIGSVGDGGTALCWITGINGVYYGSNAGSATVSSFTLTSSGAPALDQATAAATHPGTTDSAASPDGRFLYVESGGSGAFDVFAVSSTGALTPVETVWNIPVGSEGIAVS